MKVLIVNESDIKGGAARAAFRLHNALLNIGIESQMLVQRRIGDADFVLGPSSKLQELIGKVRIYLNYIPVLFYRNRTRTFFSPSVELFSNIVQRINDINPDIVHFHWVCGGMLRIEDVAKIKAPIVWSLHDMWSFTGGCHYDEGCGGYKKNCGSCKVLRSTNPHDLSYKILKRKQKSFSDIENLSVVGLSKWLAACASESSLFKNRNIINLPNPIDTEIFSPVCQRSARASLSLPQDKKLILFGALKATSDPRKGFCEIFKALSKLECTDVEIVVFGSQGPKESQGFKYKTHYLGHLNDDASLRSLYSASDVMVVPSLQENLSNAIMESMACGTPVVGFDIGGNGDMIQHQESGYLATPFDSNDLARGLEWVLNHVNYKELSQKARDKVLYSFESTHVANHYVSLYKEILNDM